MTKEEIRNCLSTLYDAQALRIATGNRLFQIFSKKSEDENNEESEDKSETELDASKINKEVLEEYEKIIEYKQEKKKTVKPCLNALKEELKFIDSEEKFEQTKAYAFLLESEKTYNKLLQKTVEQHPVYSEFLSEIKGCGPLMAANLIAYLDPYKARHASAFQKYAGLDVVISKTKDGEPLLDEEGNILTHGRSRSDTEDYEYINKAGETTMKKGLTYNPILKSKLIGVLAPCIIKAKDPKYSKIYYDYKLRLQQMPKHQNKSKAHQNNMALRYMIKWLLADLWTYWRNKENLPVSESYAISKLGMNPHGFNY